MNRPRIWTLVLLLLGSCLQAANANDRPNILVILADDLGYSDLGCFGGEIQTPHLDRLAANGLRFTQFYNTARCWPTRAALMTGYYAQQVRRDKLPGIRSGNRGVRPDWAPLLPELLRPSGYRCYHSGKWHLDGMPLQTGFDLSYYLRDQGRFFSPRVHYKNDQKLPPVERGSGYYGTTAIADHAIECLQQHQRDHVSEPFFHYLAFTAPHFPLHALPEDIARYRDTYGAGWDTIRRRRWERLQKMGVAQHLSAVETNLGPPYHFPEALEILGDGEVNRPLNWEQLSPQQQRFQETKMVLHAAMIDRMDREIGRVLDQLEQMDAIDNTAIFFLSDNGASAEIMVRDDGHDPQAAPGSAATYLCLGPGWSTSSNTPFRRHKTWVHEGGISTPLVVHWPQGISARGDLRSNPGHVIDILPTVLEIAGIESVPPRPKQPARPGVSLVPAFTTDNTVSRDHLWWSHEANHAYRVGDWKIVRSGPNSPWELYDLSRDRTETNNLASDHADKVEQLSTAWHARVTDFLSHLE